MTTKTKNKNFKLSADFGEYTLDNPDILDEIPQNAQIIMGDARDKKLTNENKRILVNGKGNYYQAIKTRDGWKVERIAKKHK